MSVFFTKSEGKRLPSDAIQVTNSQIAEFYTRVIATYKPMTQIWSLIHGPSILGGAGAITGIYVNNFFRRKFRLANYGQFATYLPIVALPTIMTSLFHKTSVQKDIIVNPNGCLICAQSKAALIQLLFGVAQPVLLAPTSALVFATRHFTYRFPSILQQPKEFFTFMGKISKPLWPIIGIHLGLQCVLAFYITYKEKEQFFVMEREITRPLLDSEQFTDEREVLKDDGVANN